FEVRRSLDVRIRVKRQMKAHVVHRLSELLDVEVVNLSNQPQQLAARASLELELDGGGWRPYWFTALNSSRVDEYYGFCQDPIELLPGATASLIGTDRLDGLWEDYARPHPIKLRAVFRPASHHSRSPLYYSNWAAIEVLE